MISFSCGEVTVPTSSIEEGLLIVNEVQRLNRDKEIIEYYESIKYGHVFGYDRKCVCGLSEMDYHMKPKRLCLEYKI